MSLFVWCALKIGKAGHLNRFRAPTVVTRRRSINSTKVDWVPSNCHQQERIVNTYPFERNSYQIPPCRRTLRFVMHSGFVVMLIANDLTTGFKYQSPSDQISDSAGGSLGGLLLLLYIAKKTPSGESVRVILPESSEIWIPYWGPCRIRANYSFQVFDTRK